MVSFSGEARPGGVVILLVGLLIPPTSPFSPMPFSSHRGVGVLAVWQAVGCPRAVRGLQRGRRARARPRVVPPAATRVGHPVLQRSLGQNLGMSQGRWGAAFENLFMHCRELYISHADVSVNVAPSATSSPADSPVSSPDVTPVPSPRPGSGSVPDEMVEILRKQNQLLEVLSAGQESFKEEIRDARDAERSQALASEARGPAAGSGWSAADREAFDAMQGRLTRFMSLLEEDKTAQASGAVSAPVGPPLSSPASAPEDPPPQPQQPQQLPVDSAATGPSLTGEVANAVRKLERQARLP